MFESADFFVVLARTGDTAESLALEYLGDASRSWMIEESAGAHEFTEDQEVIIPRRLRNPVGIYPWGYQLVPVLVYHNIGPNSKGRLLISAARFEEHVRHLRAGGYQAISLAQLLEFAGGRQPLPRKSVLIAFDDGYRSFLDYARPVLKELGFTATLFVYTDFIGASRGALSWADLRALAEDGFDVQAHSKSHRDLRRGAGESDTQYQTRLNDELELPLRLFRRHLGRGSQALAYPYGATDDELMRHVLRHGYQAAFTVKRESNPSFVAPLRMSRSQIYADHSVADLARNLAVFHQEDLVDRRDPRRAARSAPGGGDLPPPASLPAGVPSTERAAAHRDRGRSLEQRRFLRQALDEYGVALTLDPLDGEAAEARARLEAEVESEVADLVRRARAALGRGLHGEARHLLLAALALDPAHTDAFSTLRSRVQDVASIVHTVRSGDTLETLAELYYGDAARAEVIAETNALLPHARLAPGRTLRVPQIPGVPFLPH